jgi:hypothetical protein
LETVETVVPGAARLPEVTVQRQLFLVAAFRTRLTAEPVVEVGQRPPVAQVELLVLVAQILLKVRVAVVVRVIALEHTFGLEEQRVRMERLSQPVSLAQSAQHSPVVVVVVRPVRCITRVRRYLVLMVVLVAVVAEQTTNLPLMM